MTALLTQIRDTASQFRRSERRVADVVLSDPRAVLQMSIRQVAERADVSEPTVMRFAQQLGYSGYRAFSYALAAEVGRQRPSMRTDISADDDVESLAAKICGASIAALDQLRTETDWAAVERAVTALQAASRFEFYGVGASGLVAADAQQKFFRLGRPAVAYSDPHQQVMSASVADARTALVLFSFTGQSPEIVEAAQIARAGGANRIGVTRTGSPLAAACSHVIPVPEMEDTFLYTPMSSRLVQLVLVDVLVSALALRSGPELDERLGRIKDALGRMKSAGGQASSGTTANPGDQRGYHEPTEGGSRS